MSGPLASGSSSWPRSPWIAVTRASAARSGGTGTWSISVSRDSGRSPPPATPSEPAASNSLASREPRNPAPPVITTFTTALPESARFDVDAASCCKSDMNAASTPYDAGRGGRQGGLPGLGLRREVLNIPMVRKGTCWASMAPKSPRLRIARLGHGYRLDDDGPEGGVELGGLGDPGRRDHVDGLRHGVRVDHADRRGPARRAHAERKAARRRGEV